MLKIYKKIEDSCLRIIENLENQKITLIAGLVSFFSIAFLRVFLESISVQNDYFVSGLYSFLFFHYTVFYLFYALVIILILYFFTKEKIEKITKLCLFAFLLILLPPIVDLFISGGAGGIATLYPRPAELPKNILDFLGYFSRTVILHPTGILFFGQESSLFGSALFESNYGIKIELNFFLLGIIWYIFLKTKNILKVFSGLVFTYLIIFITANFTSRLYGTAASLNPNFNAHFIIFSLYFIFSCAMAAVWFFIYDREKCLSFFKNLRLTRIIHNIALLGFGLYLAGVPILNPSALSITDYPLIAIAVISILLYWASAVGYDDLSDEKIDKISNPSRPIPQNKFTREEFKTVTNLLRVAAYLTAFAVGYAFFIFIFLRSLLGHLYYAYPFRLKRFPVFGTFINALAFLFTIYAGFLVKAGNSMLDFPGKLAIFVLVAFTLGGTMKDLKDYRGDKAGGNLTIPVILGLEKGKKIIGALCFIGFIMSPVFFFDSFGVLILPSILAGILSFLLINKIKEDERWPYPYLFLIYFSYGLYFALTVF